MAKGFGRGRRAAAVSALVLVLLLARGARVEGKGYCASKSEDRIRMQHELMARGGGAEVGGDGEEKRREEKARLEASILKFREVTKAGSRRGHLIPGVMWIIWATWWHLHLCIYWVRARRRASPRPRAPRGKTWASSLSSWVPCKQRRVASQPWFEGFVRRTELVEPIGKFAFPALGIFFELYFHYPSDVCYHSLTLGGRFDHATTNLWLHTGLYAGVLCSGAVDLLVHLRCLPRPLDKVVHVLVFVNQGMLFAVHLTGSGLSVMMHSILVGLTFSYAGAAAVDFFLARHLAAAMLRPFFLFLMGLWICLTGEVLFPPVGDNTILRLTPLDADAVGQEGLAWFLRYQDDPHLTMMVIPLFLSFYALCVMGAMCAALGVAARAMAGAGWRKEVMAERTTREGDEKGHYNAVQTTNHESNSRNNEPSSVVWK